MATDIKLDEGNGNTLVLEADVVKSTGLTLFWIQPPVGVQHEAYDVHWCMTKRMV